MKEVSLLDYGFINLKDRMGSDARVIEAARASHGQDDRTGIDLEGDAKLLRYLMRNRHSTPFEHVVFTFVVQAPLFVLRQWHRHRTQSYSEISGRYTEFDGIAFIPDPTTIGVQSAKNKQGRELVENPNAQKAAHLIETSNHESFLRYEQLLEMDVPREIARGVLPLNTYSRMYTTVNLWNLFHFLELRDHPHAQYEIRVYAQATLDLIRDTVPVSVQAFEERRNANSNSI